MSLAELMEEPLVRKVKPQRDKGTKMLAEPKTNSRLELMVKKGKGRVEVSALSLGKNGPVYCVLQIASFF